MNRMSRANGRGSPPFRELVCKVWESVRWVTSLYGLRFGERRKPRDNEKGLTEGAVTVGGTRAGSLVVSLFFRFGKDWPRKMINQNQKPKRLKPSGPCRWEGKPSL